MVGAPQSGQLIKINFNPQRGSEQAGYRPALVLSRTAYNQEIGMMLACPVSTRQKGYVTEVPLPESLTTKGVVLGTQLKALDWRVRPFTVTEEVDDEVLEQVLDRLIAVIE